MRWESQFFKDFYANNQKLTNMQLVIDENDFVHYVQSNGRVSETGSEGELSFITDKYMHAGEDKAEILPNAIVNTRYNIGEIITNDTVVWGNDKNKYSVGNTDMEKLIRHDKIVYVEPTINDAFVIPENDDPEVYVKYDQMGNFIRNGYGSNSIVKMDFNFAPKYKAFKGVDKYGLVIVEPENTRAYEIYAHEIFAHARHNQEGKNDANVHRIYYQIYRDSNGIHFAGEIPFSYNITKDTTVDTVFNDILKNQLENNNLTHIVDNGFNSKSRTADKEIIDMLKNKNSDYYRYFQLEIKEKLEQAKNNKKTTIELNLPFYKNYGINMEEKAAVQKENEVIRQHGMRDRGAY